MAWQPQSIKRFVRGFPTSARTALVETDAGLGYLKAMGGPEGPHTLASELVATQLAAWIGLPTFDWCVIQVDEIDEIPFVDESGNVTGIADPGPAFISREERGITWFGGHSQLKLVSNLADVSRLVVFDTWVLNCDRHSPWDVANKKQRKPNRDNVFLSERGTTGTYLLKAMDHTHCFTCGREWTRKLGHVDIIRDKRVFGVFPEFQRELDKAAVVSATSRLKTISREKVQDIIDSVPSEWEVSTTARDAIVNLIVQRAHFVADSIASRLWPQGKLFPEE